MGFNSWDCYGASVTETEILANAYYMARKLRRFGYEYVVVDIQWYEPLACGCNYRQDAELCMDGHGRLLPAPNRFPSGFPAISDHIHGLGLKFGIHIMRGLPRQAVRENCEILKTNAHCADIALKNSACPWNKDMFGIDASKPGAYEYIKSLFDLYEAWGVDFIKIDDICNTRFSGDPFAGKAELELYRRCIDECSREIVLSLSPGPAPVDRKDLLMVTANMFRITDDVWDSWNDIRRVVNTARDWSSLGRGPCYPDCDILPIGRLAIRGDNHGGTDRHSNLSLTELHSMMGFWCLFGSPLFIGGNLPDLTEEELSILTDERILEIAKGSQNARFIKEENGVQVWENDGYRGLFNMSDNRAGGLEAHQCRLERRSGS